MLKKVILILHHKDPEKTVTGRSVGLATGKLLLLLGRLDSHLWCADISPAVGKNLSADVEDPREKSTTIRILGLSSD